MRDDTRQSEMPSSSGEGGSETNRPYRPWYRPIWFLTLVLLLAVGPVSVVVSHRKARHAALHGLGCQVSTVKASLRYLHNAVNQFYMDNGRWPAQEEGLTVLVRRPADAVNRPPGGYLETTEVPKDPWGHDFVYEFRPNGEPPFVIKTLGADGAVGGEGNDANLLSRT